MPTAIYIVAVVSLVIFFAGFALYAVYTHSTRASLAARSAADAVLPLHGDVKLIHARAIPSHWPRFLAPVRTEIASKHALTDLPFFNSHRAGLEIVENGEKHPTLTVIGLPWPTQVDPVQVHLTHETQLHSLASPEYGLPLPLKALIADEVLKRAIQAHGHAMKQSDVSRSSQFFASRLTQVPFVRPSRHVIRRLGGFVRIACISAPYLTGHPLIELQPLRGKGTTIFVQPFDYAPVSLNMPGSGKSGGVHYRSRWCSSARRRWSGAARVVRRDILKPTSMKSVVTPQPATVGPTKDDFFAPLNYPEDYYDLEFVVPSHEDGSALALRLIDAVSFVCATVVCAGFYVGSHVSSRFLTPPYPRYDKSDKALLFPTAVRRYLADPNGDLYSITDARLFAHVHSLVSRLAYLVPRY